MSIIYINKSMISGKSGSMEFNMTEQEFEESYSKWKDGMLIQQAFPTLSREEREFIKTGILPEEWTAVFGKDA